MGFDAQDKELIRLITKLKKADGKYPPDLLAARRQRYLKQMGQMGVGMGVATGIKNAVRGGKTPAISSATSTILESALMVAIVAETGTVAYFYRDKLAEVFQSIKNREEPSLVEVPPSPIFTGQEIQEVTLSAPVNATQPSSTLAPSPTAIEIPSTPIPNIVEENNTINASSTAAPSANNLNNAIHGNNGNHYGQTPKPQRTKEPKNNNASNNNNNNQPPKDNSKPPKAK